MAKTIGTPVASYKASAQEWVINDPILEKGDIGFETETGSFKMGDGIHRWTELSYVAPDIPSSLPAVSSDDNGKFLGVSSGEWSVVSAPSGGGVEIITATYVEDGGGSVSD